MIKLINIDIDGTIVNSEGVVTDYTKEVLKKAKEKGVEIVLTSGRPIKSTQSIAEELGIDNYIICGNGAILYDVKKEEVLFGGFLSREKVMEIANLCASNSIYYNVYTDQDILTEELTYNVLFYHRENAFKMDDKKTNINIVENIPKYIEENNIDHFLKITVCDSSEMVFNNIMKRLREIEDIEVLDVGYMSRKVIKYGTDFVNIDYYYTEISKSDINKWHAVEKLMKVLDIKTDEVMAIGDNVNDMEMIEHAGIGVAMDNSGDKIKEVADYVTDDNDNDGVAKIIEKLVLNEGE